MQGRGYGFESHTLHFRWIQVDSTTHPTGPSWIQLDDEVLPPKLGKHALVFDHHAFGVLSNPKKQFVLIQIFTRNHLEKLGPPGCALLISLGIHGVHITASKPAKEEPTSLASPNCKRMLLERASEYKGCARVVEGHLARVHKRWGDVRDTQPGIPFQPEGWCLSQSLKSGQEPAQIGVQPLVPKVVFGRDSRTCSDVHGCEINDKCRLMPPFGFMDPNPSSFKTNKAS